MIRLQSSTARVDASDLEALTLQCRNERTREFVREAVDALNAGALRSCVVMTWAAVVFDLISKIYELHIIADDDTRKRVSALGSYLSEKATSPPEVSSNRAHELEILRAAQEDFELLTRSERADLARLERHATIAASPMLYTAEKPHAPARDVVVAHLVNAVALVLAREPVQGSAKLDSVWEVIASPYFPVHPEAARASLVAGPLARMSNTLVRVVFSRLVESILLDQEVPEYARRQQYAALIAVVGLGEAIARRTAELFLNRTMKLVPRARAWVLIEFFAQIRDSWRFAENALKRDCKRYVGESRGEQLARTIHYALQVPALVDAARERIPGLDLETLLVLEASGDIALDATGEVTQIFGLRVTDEEVEQFPVLTFQPDELDDE